MTSRSSRLLDEADRLPREGVAQLVGAGAHRGDYGIAVALRCLYTDLDGTLLGKNGNLFGDADGNFSRSQALMLEACHRAGVEVVIMSGRRENTVRSDARLIGQTSYIYEAGCAMTIDLERTYLTGEWLPNEDGTPAERIIAAGLPELLFDRFERPARVPRALASRSASSRCSSAARSTSTRSTRCSSRRGPATSASSTTAPSAGRCRGSTSPTPTTSFPAGPARARPSAPTCAPADTRPSECIAAGDSIEDLGAAEYVGRFFCVANGPQRDEALREAIVGLDNVTVTEGRMGEGVYEAVVSTLAGAA